MKIQCIDKKTFELTDGSKKVGHITYDGLFSYSANAVVDEVNYKITPKGIFSSTISVTKNEIEIAHLQMNWKGHIIISLPNGKNFLLRTTGTFQSKYVLEDENQQKLMLLNPDFN